MTGMLVAAVAAMVITGMLTLAALSAWRGWLELKRLELTHEPCMTGEREHEPAALIEIASVKERLRRLEAIASGVEL